MTDLAVGFGSELPASWTVAAIHEVAEISPKLDVSALDEDQLVHFVPMASVAEDFGGLDASQLRPLREVRKGYTGFSEGDVLFAKITPCMENGKGSIVPKLSHLHAFGSTEFHVLRPGGAVADKWLAYYLSQPDFRRVARQHMTGTAGQLRVPAKWLSLVGIPLPPRAEQSRIVEKLEELLSDLDAGVAELKAVQRKLAQYRQSLLKAAVDGILTADWRAARGAPQETGAELLQRILTERRARWEQKQLAKYAEQGKTPPKGWQAKYSEPAYPDLTGYLSLPEGWTWTSLDQLIAESSYGTSVKCGYDRGGEPVLRIPNVGSGKIDLQDMKFATERLSLEAEDYLAVGDVLVIRTNGSIGLVGRAAVVSDVLPSPHYFASYLLRLRCVETACSHRWINFVLASPVGRHWIESKAASSAGQHNISLSTLLTMPVPLPPIAEQEGALIAVETALEAASEQLRTIEKSLGQTAAQRKNLLRAAFSGQLVPQDPNDEPAGELLARIRAARERSPAPRGRRRSASHPAPATNPPTPTPRGRKAKAGA